MSSPVFVLVKVSKPIDDETQPLPAVHCMTNETASFGPPEKKQTKMLFKKKGLMKWV